MLLIKTRFALPDSAPILRVDPGFVTFVLDLEGGGECIWDTRLTAGMRTDVRKGLRFDVEMRIGGPALFKDFLAVVRECWRDLGTPTHSVQFYRALLETWGDEARIMNLYHRGRAVSTAMLLPAGSTIHHPFSCTLAAYKSTSVNSALTWHIIEWASDSGFRFFDMGRSPVDSGSFRYKKKWGAEQVALNYGYLMDPERPIPSLHTPTVDRAVRAWKLLPLPLANVLGPHFIKYAL